MNLTIRGTLELSDYVRAMRLNMRPRRWLGVVGVVLAVLWGAISVFGIVQAARFGRGWGAALALAGAGLILLYYFFIGLPRSWRRLFEQQKSFRLPVDATLDSDGIESRNELGYARIPWNYIRKWRSDRNVVLFYHSDTLMQFFPKRFLSDDGVKTLESHLRKTVGPAERTDAATREA